MQLLQTELSDSKQKNDQLEDQLTQTQTNIFTLQEEIIKLQEKITLKEVCNSCD